MADHCSYCAAASTIAGGDVFCSRHMNDFEGLDTGVFYIKGTNIYSDEHQSRFALRFFLQGTHHLTLDNIQFKIAKTAMLNFNTYSPYNLHIPEGQVEAREIGIGFRPSLVRSAHAYYQVSDNSLLDNPSFSEHAYLNRPVLRPVTKRWQAVADKLLEFAAPDANVGIEERDHFADSVLSTFMQQAVDIKKYHQQLTDIRKISTRDELINRLMIARDFIETESIQLLSTPAAAQAALLSEFHFIRSFRMLFNESPYQAIMRRKMNHARLLLLTTDKPVKTIGEEAGYQNNAAFARNFKQFFNIQPSAVRKLK